MINKSIRVFGRVQGVGFRFTAQRAAQSYGLKGYVKNMPDGSVFIEAEGRDENMGHFIGWCKKGPAYSIVSELEVAEGKFKNYKHFDIKF